jgi:hypothetical protein
LGFRLTPYTEHDHSPAPGAALEPAGTANRCIMLREGYLEILTATRDTPLAAEVRGAMARHVGVHLAAFGVNDAVAEHARLTASGFPQRPPVALKRDAQMADGRSATLRFTVVRPEAGLLPEGRVQFLVQETPEQVWEERWLHQPNGAVALTDIALCVNDVDECAARYERYLRTDAEHAGRGRRVLRFQRGTLAIMTPLAARDAFAGAEPAVPPAMAGYALRCDDLAATRHFLEAAGYNPLTAGLGALVLPMAPTLGGLAVFHDGAGPGWYS